MWHIYAYVCKCGIYIYIYVQMWHIYMYHEAYLCPKEKLNNFICWKIVEIMFILLTKVIQARVPCI